MKGEARVGVGDLVVCASRELREGAAVPLETGIYLVDRRRDGLVYFAGADRAHWLPHGVLRSLAADDPRVTPAPRWLVDVHRAMRLLRGTDLELERREGGGFDVRIGCPGLDGALWRQLEGLLGGQGAELRIQPGSMSRVLVVYPAGGPAASEASGEPGGTSAR